MNEEHSQHVHKSLASSRNRRPQKANPLQSAISKFVAFLKLSRNSNLLLDTSNWPKRYSLYPPLLLLPPNFPSYSTAWQSLYSNLDELERTSLFASVVTEFKGQGISHVAINAPISSEAPEGGHLNLMRSPTGLLPVYGDFGPLVLPSRLGPTDFDEAFWVSAVQNGGIVQVWAPLWTMFSRGNISEKARILEEGTHFKGLTEGELGEIVGEVDVIDFYVGIGYFAFSYLKRGVRRVWGWEINEWSVEGFRRGAERNGWEVKIVRISEHGDVPEVQIAEIVHTMSRGNGSQVRCIVFHGDNKWTAKVMSRIGDLLEASGKLLNLRHANLGLLPTSKASWKDAVGCLDQSRGGWLHVHENADMKALDAKKKEIVEQIRRLVVAHRGEFWRVSCCHIEQVKTYAPGVMHCVFDIEILPAR